jgi:hypothetical protein
MPEHPPFGTLVRDSVYADGEGGTLNRVQFEVEVERRREEVEAIKEYQRSQGKPTKRTKE